MIDLNNILSLSLLPRTIFNDLTSWFDERSAIFIVGSRQVGKTSLLYLIVQYLYNKKKLAHSNFAFLDMEDITDFSVANKTVDDLIEFLTFSGKKWSKNKKLYLFIDEIHLLDNPAKLVKLIVDHHRQIKLFVTGSSSTEIRKKFSDTLPGRKQEFFLSPLSFMEYLTFEDDLDFKDIIQKDFNKLFDFKIPGKNTVEMILKKLLPKIEHYLIYGGYPEITLTNIKKNQVGKLNSIFNDYVRKDISTLFTVEHLNSFTLLIKILAEQNAGILNISNLSSDCDINFRTIKRYLDILETTFVIKRLNPFNRKIKKRLTKSPKVFFLDNGIRNCALNNFLNFENRTDTGQLLESFIYQVLNRVSASANSNELFFWRTANQSEVDFIYNDYTIEVKKGDWFKPPPRQMFECMDILKLKRGIIINKSRFEKIKLDKKEFLFLPYAFLGL